MSTGGFKFILHMRISDSLENAQIRLSDQLAPADHESEVRFAAHMKLFPLNGFNGFLMEVADNLELHENVSSEQTTPADYESEVRFAPPIKVFPLNGLNS